MIWYGEELIGGLVSSVNADQRPTRPYSTSAWRIEKAFDSLEGKMRRLSAAWSIPLFLSMATGCATPEPKPPNATQPLDERRAIGIITQVYKEAGATASAGRPVRLATGRSLRVDVGTEGRRYGIAYLTGADRALLDEKDLPPHAPGGDLPVVQGAGPDGDAVILVLFAEDYQDDDFRGTEREATGIAAERKLARDVRDFLAQARLRKLP